MLGEKVVEELKRYEGENVTISMNDVVFSGKINLKKEDDYSSPFEVGEVTFLIFKNNEYEFISKKLVYPVIDIWKVM